MYSLEILPTSFLTRPVEGLCSTPLLFCCTTVLELNLQCTGLYSCSTSFLACGIICCLLCCVRQSGMDCGGGDHLWCVLVLMLYLPKKKAVQVHNKWQKQKMQFSHPKNSVLQFHIFKLLCVMELILSISPISPSNKVWHGPFGACSGIFRHKLFTKSCFRCIVYKLPSTFLVLWHTKLQLFLQWLPLRYLAHCGTFVAGLDPLPHA